MGIPRVQLSLRLGPWSPGHLVESNGCIGCSARQVYTRWQETFVGRLNQKRGTRREARDKGTNTGSERAPDGKGARGEKSKMTQMLLGPYILASRSTSQPAYTPNRSPIGQAGSCSLSLFLFEQLEHFSRDLPSESNEIFQWKLFYCRNFRERERFFERCF